ncbi:MAG: hypothetical protein P8N76_27130 [Pirellulaceae bacterium]|nr:hypothetical protein [Pirellulaceae bacterium]
MSVCDLSSGTGRLQKATRELVQQWEQTGEQWNDKTRQEFEKRHLQPISPSVRLLLAHAAELMDTLQKAERDCRDEMELER